MGIPGVAAAAGAIPGAEEAGIGDRAGSGAAGKAGAGAVIGLTAGAAAGAGLDQPAGAVLAISADGAALGAGDIGCDNDGPRSPGTSNIAAGSAVSTPVTRSKAAATVAIAFCIAVSQSDRMSLSTNGLTC